MESSELELALNESLPTSFSEDTDRDYFLFRFLAKPKKLSTYKEVNN